MYNSLILSSAIAFITTLMLTPYFIKVFKLIGQGGIDQHKKEKPFVPNSQGIPITIGILFGLFSYLAIITFVTKSPINAITLFASITTIMMITIVGFFDDLFIGKKKQVSRSGTHDYRIGLRQKQKALLILPAAIPLMVINAGDAIMSIPIIGAVNFGILYPLLLVPIGVLCVANAYNMLGGINGIESGMAIIALLGLGVISYWAGATEAMIISFISAAGFLGIMKYAKTPAKILPGDSATYLAGALIATIVIIGNLEKFGIIIFTPWIIEAFIKLKNKFQGTSLGKLQKDGTLKPLRGKTESLTHVIMNLGNFNEKQIMYIFWIMELGFVTLAFGLYFTGVI